MIEKLKQVDDLFEDENGISYESPLDYLHSCYLDLCACGNPDDLSIYIRDLLLKLRNQDWQSYEDLPYMFFVNWANEKGYAEHGTTIRCSWLTVLGKELLRDLMYCLGDKSYEQNKG